MPMEVVMPKFGLTMQAGTIQQWFKAAGEAITAGQPLFEVETEKVLYDVEAPASGVVAKLLYPVEAPVRCGRVVAVIAVAGEDPAAVAARYPDATPIEADTSLAAPVTGVLSDVAVCSDQRERDRAMTPAAGPPAAGLVATPAARKLAKDSGVDLATLAGSGPGGRITREDVEAAVTARGALLRGSPLRGMRKTIAERMVKSLQSTAQLTLVTEVDVTALVRRRAEPAAQTEVTYTDMIVAAVAAALREHPRLRVTVEGDAMRAHEAVHIGIAVALDEGLIVPVIRDADRKTVREIAEVSRLLVEKARAGTLGVDDVSGGIFTITNLGMYGIDAFTPIINLPQIAILGVGRIVEKPAVHAGEIAIRSLLTLSLTFDHRSVDGAPAAAFLHDVAERLGA
jgi:pyruvate dehydrogenase E2 component (dihydrolipoamide acetyltransferase)